MPPSLPLDPDQQAAVDHREGACLVLAGPGSGKTRVIVERFLALLEAGVPAERPLVLTFTVCAAAGVGTPRRGAPPPPPPRPPAGGGGRAGQPPLRPLRGPPPAAQFPLLRAA